MLVYEYGYGFDPPRNVLFAYVSGFLDSLFPPGVMSDPDRACRHTILARLNMVRAGTKHYRRFIDDVRTMCAARDLELADVGTSEAELRLLELMGKSLARRTLH